jgi:hypothetical protein
MNSLSLPEQVAEYLGENFSDGEQSAPLNGNPIQQAYCAPDKMTDFSRLSRFGMTYKPLTENLGKELLTLFRAGFPAKTLAQPEKAQGLTGSDQECGSTWRGWLAKYDPDTSSWRTAQCSLLEDLNESLATLPRSGMTRNGLLWELPMLEQTIKGTEFGLLPTPTMQGLNGGSNSRKAAMARGTWPTPVCQDSRHATTRHLDQKSQHWKSNLGEVVMSLEPPNIGGRLNPTWVEWLMGWPLGWTDLKPLETDKSHCVQQQHGES